jgi:outer membrane protein assembly factor BamB
VDRRRTGSTLLAAAACAAALAGCAGQPATVTATTRTSSAANAGPASATRSATPATVAAPSAPPELATLPAPWPEHVALREDLSLAVASQAFDPATGTVYALLPQHLGDVAGPWVLTAISVRTGAARRGGTFRTSELTLAGGYLWLYDSASDRPRVDEVAPGTLTVVRAIPLPSGPSPFGAGPKVAAAPDGSAWVGTRHELLRVSVRTGTVLATATLPAGLAVVTMATDPDGGYLYVAAAREVGGGAVEGAIILEFSERTGALLATADGDPIRYSIAGATLTAVPGGVWASFRTGSLGASVLLSGRGLAVITAPHLPAARLSAYYWAMSSTSVYGGGTLWVTATIGSLVACLDPATGKVIARETVHSPRAQLNDLLAVDPATGELYGTAVDGSFGALVSVKPPAACWA